MIINRFEWSIKHGRMGEAVAWFRALNWPKPLRLARSEVGTLGILAVEAEYEDMVDYQKTYAEFWARPDAGAQMAELNELLDAHGQEELWKTFD